MLLLIDKIQSIIEKPKYLEIMKNKHIGKKLWHFPPIYAIPSSGRYKLMKDLQETKSDLLSCQN